MVQFALNIVPLSDLRELCGKQVVEITCELLLQLHYECLWKLIRVGELSTEDSEDRVDQTSIPIGLLRTPTQLRKAIQKRSPCGYHTTLPRKIRGIRNLTLAILSRHCNLQEGHRGHFVLDPEDNGRADQGIADGSQSLSTGVGRRGSGHDACRSDSEVGGTQSDIESHCQSDAGRVCKEVGQGQPG